MNKLEQMLEELSNATEQEEAIDSRKTNVTVKVDDFGLFRADYLAKKFGMTRTGFCQEVLLNSLYDSFRMLGYSDEEEFNLYVEARKAEKEAK